MVPTLDHATAPDCGGRFREFAGQRRPVLITGLGPLWGATTHWSLEALWARGGCNGGGGGGGGPRLRVGDADGDDGQPVRMALRDFLQYLVAQTDDDPLYLFDEDFCKACPEMLTDYSVPAELFVDDVLSLYPFDYEGCGAAAGDGEGGGGCGGNRGAGGGEAKVGRVPSAPSSSSADVTTAVQLRRSCARKWLLIGPQGSGTDVHTDPPGTGAWNSGAHALWWPLHCPATTSHQHQHQQVPVSPASVQNPAAACHASSSTRSG
jgi:hypothetical protein